jgi:ankyrin repeat protein
MFLACEIESSEIIEVMCDHGELLTNKNSMNQTPLMFASIRNKLNILNYLSLRTHNLDDEDDNHLTILAHQLFNKRLVMASRLLNRGASIDYVNSDGKSIMHMCIENQLINECKFLLNNGANPHIMDLEGRDVCDKANDLGVTGFEVFDNCSFKKKTIPMLPDGTYPPVSQLIYYNN